MYEEINRMKAIQGTKHSEQQAGKPPQKLSLRTLIRRWRKKIYRHIIKSVVGKEQTI